MAKLRRRSNEDRLSTGFYSELDDTTTGWAAEAGMTDYFMQPVTEAD
jgi:hypothetical protein